MEEVFVSGRRPSAFVSFVLVVLIVALRGCLLLWLGWRKVSTLTLHLVERVYYSFRGDSQSRQTRGAGDEFYCSCATAV